MLCVQLNSKISHAKLAFAGPGSNNQGDAGELLTQQQMDAMHAEREDLAALHVDLQQQLKVGVVVAKNRSNQPR